MYKSIFKSILALSLAVLVAGPALAADRQVTVGGIFEKEVFFPIAFGSASESLAVNMDIIFDDSNANIGIITAGTPVGFNGETLPYDVTLIPISAISSLSATIGNGTWGLEDLQSSAFLASGLNFGILISGSIDNPLNLQPAVSFNLLDFNVGAVSVGQIACGNGSCLVTAGGVAEDYLEGSSGAISFISASVSTVNVEPTVEEKLLSLQEQVEALGISDALLDSVNAKLEAKSGDHPAAVNKLNAFINSIESQRGKKLTDAQADDLVSQANSIIDDLN